MKRRPKHDLKFWILDADHQPVPADLMTWAEQLGDIDKRIVRKTRIGNAEVSTVFIGLDHSFGAGGPPRLFETMIFSEVDSEIFGRSSTWDEALLQHAKACHVVRINGGQRNAASLAARPTVERGGRA